MEKPQNGSNAQGHFSVVPINHEERRGLGSGESATDETTAVRLDQLRRAAGQSADPILNSQRVDKERAARAAIEKCADRPLSDLEWGRTRSQLLCYISILRTWELNDEAQLRPLPKAA